MHAHLCAHITLLHQQIWSILAEVVQDLLTTYLRIIDKQEKQIMKAYVRGLIGPIAILMILGLTAVGCTATPTPFVLTPESPTAPPEPQAPSLQAALTANETNIEVLLGNNPAQVLQKFETISLPVGGQITLDESGRGVLRFGDRHEVDLFGGTAVSIDDAKLESGGSIFVRLQQIFGHTHIVLNEQSVARVTLETGDATITTLEQGTEFAVCYNPEKVNCIAVQKGAVEIISQGEKQIYREGEATFFEPGQPPQPPFCIPQADFDEWLIQKRGPEDPGPLSELVQSSPPGSCGTPAPEPSVVDVSSPTPTRTPTRTVTVTATPTPTRAITFAPSASPTPTKEPRQPQPPTDTEQPPTEPPATEPPPSDTPAPPWIPTDTEAPPTEPPATEQPHPSDTP
jgi:hypothetical protein